MDANLLKTTGAHSATVEMWLHIGGQSLPVAQAGDRLVKLRDSATPPNGRATLEIIVDGESRRSAVTVVANGDSRWVHVSRLM
jgi:hypothetical protein